MRGLRAGLRDRLVEVLRAEIVDDGFGTHPGLPGVFTSFWAERADVSDGERFANGIDAAVLSTRFRTLSTVTSRQVRISDTLRCDGRDFDIVGVKEIEGRAGLEITANARAD